MEISDLVIFKTVVEAGGVTRAAQRLHRVQSNVTTRIRQLEQKLGVALFVREGRGLHLSPAGETLLKYVESVLSLVDEAKAAVCDESPRGTLRLGAMESAAAVRLPPVLSAFNQRYPAVRLGLRTGNPKQLSAAVRAGEIDAALVVEPVIDGPFDKLPIYSEELVIVARADQPIGGKRTTVPPTIVAFEEGCPHRQRLEAWYAQRNDMPARVVEIGSYHAMLGCVAAGMGVALLPRSVLDTFPHVRLLSIHRVPPGLRRARTFLIWRKGAASPNIRALTDLLLQLAANQATS